MSLSALVKAFYILVKAPELDNDKFQYVLNQKLFHIYSNVILHFQSLMCGLLWISRKQL